MHYAKKIIELVDNYLIARIKGRPSTALFWYLPEPANVCSALDVKNLYSAAVTAPLYLVDYRLKLKYSLKNAHGIIVLPYADPVGCQLNPEAAFQYALGLHDMYLRTKDRGYLKAFLYYAGYFAERQTTDGLWQYEFDWYASKAPWSSALAQGRGASVMLRAWMHTQDAGYLSRTKAAFKKFADPISDGGFLHVFQPAGCQYFEEYPNTPTGVLNGFMSSLMSLWDVNYYLKNKNLADLFNLGLLSLKKMLPHYTNGWWSLYDLDADSPIQNVNSPRYHKLEINYLQILSYLTRDDVLTAEYKHRLRQYHNLFYRCRALGLKTARKILYR